MRKLFVIAALVLGAIGYAGASGAAPLPHITAYKSHNHGGTTYSVEAQ